MHFFHLEIGGGAIAGFEVSASPETGIALTAVRHDIAEAPRSLL
jgi:hypothetical protein